MTWKERDLNVSALNKHRLGMEMTRRAASVTHSGKHVRKLATVRYKKG